MAAQTSDGHTAGEYDKLFLAKDSTVKIPFVAYDDYLVDGEIRKWNGPMETVTSPICHQNGDRIKIGTSHFRFLLVLGLSSTSLPLFPNHRIIVRFNKI